MGELDLPHDWSIEYDFDRNSPALGEAGFLNGGTGWYRKTFVLPAKMEGKRISIRFGGIYMDSSTYVNGTFIGNYPNGYTPFSYDITDNIVADGVTENVIAVKVMNKQPSSRWYSGSGIYRNVHMVVTEGIHVDKYGTFITTPNLKTDYDNGIGTVNVKTDIVNDSQDIVTVVVESTIYNSNNKQAEDPVISDMVDIPAGTTQVFEQNITILNPKLWSVDSPYLYTMRTEVVVSGKVVDTYETPFGMRWFEFDADTGFSLNDEWMKLHGVCMHHDQGSLGAVANYKAIERQMEIMKKMGTNAIRVTHNPASDELLEVCSKLGLLVIDEAFDTWYEAKKSNDYGRFFERNSTHPDAKSGMTWAEFDIKQMVDRGKNNPAIIMWSVGNEIGSTNSDKGLAVVKNLVRWVKEIDTTRPTTIGENKIKRTSGDGRVRINAVLNELDVAGYNYDEQNYDSQHESFPDRKIYGAETSSSTKSRGIYAHPDTLGAHDAGAHPDYQQSSYGNDHVAWGRTAVNSWKPDRDRQFVAGQFIWTGFDYIGEATPWHNQWPPKSSYFGIVDTAGFPKDDYYFYQSQWLSVEDNPMVHILPHWNWEDENIASKVTVGGEIPVRIFSNAKKVELFKDGESLGVKEFVTNETPYGVHYQEASDGNLYLEWRLPYEPGRLEAVAMDTNGNELARDVMTSAEAPAGVKLTSDRDIITADGYDLSYITVDIVDRDGNFMPIADNQINFNISGNGKIVGVDNGNAVSHERYKDADGVWGRKAFSGKALVIVQSTTNAGAFSLTASSPGLTRDRISVFTIKNNESEKTILGYKIPTMSVKIDEIYELPVQIEAFYSDGTTQMMDVSWDHIEAEVLKIPGVVKVGGSVSANGIRVEIEIIVTGIVGIKETKIVTGVGIKPIMPTKVPVVYSDGSTTEETVTWATEITDKDVAETGSFELIGTVENIMGFTAKILVRVTDEVEYTNNIAVFNSSVQGYPKASASHEGGDKVINIIDGSSVVDKRWTNWVARYANQETDWVALEFDKEYEIGQIAVNFFTDGQTKVPAKFIVETSTNGVDWIPVSEQSQTDNFIVAQSDVTTKRDISFTPVSMKHIRLQLTGQPIESKFRPVGLTEVYVYTGVVTSGNSTAELEELKLDGELIDGFMPNQYTYTKELKYGEDITGITATAKDNGTVFIIPALTADSATIVEVISEDGKASRVYTIQFKGTSAKLVSSEISLESNVITEDDIVEINLVSKLQDGSAVDNKLVIVDYDITSDNGGKIEIINNKVYAYTQGMVQIKANITYNGMVVTSNTLTATIAPSSGEKTLISYSEVSVLTVKDRAPTLPVKVRATFDKGLPKEVDVTWDIIDPENYASYGEFVVRGAVKGQGMRPTARVIVKGLSAIQNFSTATPVGVVPLLPEKAKVYFSDGTIDELPLIWESYDYKDFKKAGTVIISGTVTGNTALKTQITIRVSAEVRKSRNIAQQVDGFEMPAAIASFTNNGLVAKERVEYLNDGIVSYTATNPFNRWSSWQRTPRFKDWIGIVFGIGSPKRNISTIWRLTSLKINKVLLRHLRQKHFRFNIILVHYQRFHVIVKM